MTRFADMTPGNQQPVDPRIISEVTRPGKRGMVGVFYNRAAFATWYFTEREKQEIDAQDEPLSWDDLADMLDVTIGGGAFTFTACQYQGREVVVVEYVG